MTHPLGLETHPYEQIELDEAALIDEIIQANTKMRKHVDGREIRSQHGKTTAVAKGRLTLRQVLPPELMSWLPKSETGHPVLVRFSNGNQQDDRVPDAHGCSIRIEGVAGAPVVPSMGSEGVHDLVMVDSPSFFVRGVAEYREFSETVAPTFFKKAILGAIDIVKGDAAMRLFKLQKLTEAHPEIGPRAAEFSSRTPGSPLGTEYTSATPFALGQRAMRWVLTPANPGPVGPVGSENGLTDAARISLIDDKVGFTLSIRLAIDPERHSAENEIDPWKGAEEIPVADFLLDTQQPGEQESLIAKVEHLAFSPWNAPFDLRPIGGINRCRGRVYAAMSTLRTS
jgi:hypothetical protein